MGHVPAAKVRPEERQLNLVLALVATPNGLTKDQILGSVQGYSERASGDRRTLEKMFERDKSDLREAGIPILTLGAVDDPDDNRGARYTIPKDEYELPADITFTPAEIAVLNVAAAVWSQSSMSGAAQSALMKIRSLGIDVDEPIIGFAPRINLRDPAFPALQTAGDKALIAQFSYLKPGDARPQLRRVEPHALIEFEGRWHLFGHDHVRGAERTFLLSRIVGEVLITEDPFDADRRTGAAARALAGLERLATENVAVIELLAGSEAALRLGRRGTLSPTEQPEQASGDALTASTAIVRLPFVDAHVLADEIASFGPEARVLEPELLRDLVIARLESVVAAHAAAEPAPGATVPGATS